jgi:hypothetical protein
MDDRLSDSARVQEDAARRLLARAAEFDTANQPAPMLNLGTV